MRDLDDNLAFTIVIVAIVLMVVGSILAYKSDMQLCVEAGCSYTGGQPDKCDCK